MKPVAIAKELKAKVDQLQFPDIITHVYNPLDYAWAAHKNYLETYGNTKREIVLVGMNPGPWGMAQNGVPFGEVALVRDWLQVKGKIVKPKNEHPKREIAGWDCERSEVSGRRLWGFAKTEFKTPEQFFKRFFILNYCPLVFMEESGRNFTPDKLPKAYREPLEAICDEALAKFLEFYQPKYAIGVGGFAKKCLQRVLKNKKVQIGSVLHPSPASPKANRGWEKFAKDDFKKIGIQI